MDNQVKVATDEKGTVVIVSKNNPVWAYVKVEQIRTLVNDEGFLSKKPISALIHGTTEDLRSFNWVKNTGLEGKIYFKESTTPFNKTEPERDLKIAGETGIVCKIDGEPIYRKHFYTTNKNMSDISCPHNNIEEIRLAFAALKGSEGAAVLSNTAPKFDDL